MKCVSNVVGFLMITLIFVATFYMLMPRMFKEAFTDLSTRTINVDPNTNTPSALDAGLSGAFPTLSDRRELLLMKRCYQFPKHTIESFQRAVRYRHEQDDMYVRSFGLLTCAFKDVESRIMCELQTFRERVLCKDNASLYLCPTPLPNSQEMTGSGGGLHNYPTTSCRSAAYQKTSSVPREEESPCTNGIQGPVYALIFQAPYYRNDQNRTVSAWINSRDLFGESAARDNGIGNPTVLEDVPMYVYVQLLFSRYNSAGIYLPNKDFVNQWIIPEWDKRYFSKDAKCYLRANKASVFPTFAGCGSVDATPYAARCLGPANPIKPDVNDANDTKSSFGVLYEVNPAFAHLRKLFGESKPLTLSVPAPNACRGFRETDRVSNACLREVWRGVGCITECPPGMRNGAGGCYVGDDYTGWWRNQPLSTVRLDMQDYPRLAKQGRQSALEACYRSTDPLRG
jgi:hypothetical protein